MSELTSIIIYFCSHVILEFVYLGVYGSTYMNMIKNLLKDKSTPKHSITYAVLAYIVFFVSTYVIVFRNGGNLSLHSHLLTGALFGAAVYGIYNFTNMFLINGYDTFVALRDVIYGISSMLILVLISRYIRNKKI